MADIELIKPRDLPEQANVQATDALMVDNGTIVGKATPEKIVNAGAPVASEAEALAGVNNTKRMTPLRTRQALDNANNPAVLRAQAWAESSTPPDPLLPDSKSAKTWASIAEQGVVMVQWSMIAADGQTVLGNDITTGEPIRAYGGVAQISVNGFGPITPEEYSVDSDGVVTLTAPLVEGDVVSVFTQPRLSNSEAQAVVQGVLQQTADDVAACEAILERIDLGALDAAVLSTSTDAETALLAKQASEQAAATAADDANAQIAPNVSAAVAAKNAAETAKALSEAAADRADDAADDARDAADAAIAAGTWDYTPFDDVELAAITGMTAGQTAYVRQTMHVWQYNGTAWVDTGESPLAGKADKSALDGRISFAKAAVGILASLVTPSRQRTAMEVRTEDGAWSDWSMTLFGRRLSLSFLTDPFKTSLANDVGERLGYSFRVAPGFMFSVCTPSGMRSWIEAKSGNGRMTDYAARVVAEDILPHLVIPDSAGRPYLDGTWDHPSGERLPYDLDRRTVVSLGSSSADRSATAYQAIVEDFGVEFVNLARGGALIGQNYAQIGIVRPAITVEGGSIPATGAVNVTMNVTSNINFRSTPGTLAGVKGTLWWSSPLASMQFTRAEAGDPVPVEQGTLFYSDNVKYRACVWSFESGKNNISAGITAAQLRTETRKMVDWSAPFLNRTIIWSHFPNASYTSTQKQVCEDIEDMLISDYGNRVIAQYAWFRSPQLWVDLATKGYTPTPDDLADQAAGLVPRGLMENDGAHLTTEAYGWRAEFLLAPKLRELQIYL